MSDLLIMDPNEIDHSPVSGWEQKYVFFFEYADRGKKEYMFTYSTQWKHGQGFSKKAMDIGNQFVDHHIWANMWKWKHDTEMVRIKENGPMVEVSGIWGVCYGHVDLVGQRGKRTVVAWDMFYPLPREEVVRLGWQQLSLIDAGKLSRRPHFDDYAEERNEIVR